MSHTRITEDMWPNLKPGDVKVTKLDEPVTEALFSVGRRRFTKHVVLDRAEAHAAWIALGETFGFTKERLRRQPAA